MTAGLRKFGFHAPHLGVPLGRGELACLVFAIASAQAFVVAQVWHPSGFDALGYRLAAEDIARNGLFSAYEKSELRTYGYPLVVALVSAVARAFALPPLVLLAQVQLALHLSAVFALRAALLPVDIRTARIVFAGLLLNVFAYVYVAESLTESLSLTLAIAVSACWVRVWRSPSAVVALLAGSFIAGVAVMVRPANLFLALAWLLAVTPCLVRHRHGSAADRAARLVAALAMLVLPCVPQLVNNALHHRVVSPLVADDLGRNQHYWGVRYIKYATAVPPAPNPSILYLNPLVAGTPVDRSAPLRWYAAHPWRGLLTIALHTFALTDQDLLFTYAHDLDPWYRWPVGIVNHAVVALGLGGLIAFLRRMREGGRVSREAAFALIALAGAWWSVYALAVPEMRFGLTLLALLFPFALWMSAIIRRAGSARLFALAAFAATAYVALAMTVSDWTRLQSPQIVAAVEGVRDELPDAELACPYAFDFSTQPRGSGWSMPEPQPQGGYAMWMANGKATMSVPSSCAGALEIEFVVAGYMADDILAGMRLRIDGSEVALVTGSTQRQEPTLTGRFERAQREGPLQLELAVPRTIVPRGGNRTLAVMFKRLRLAPVRAA